MIYESDYYVGSDLGGDALAHHGVPHQRWGVKNGPPYPIQRGKDVHYNVGKMSKETRSYLEKAGKIVKSGAKTVGTKAKSSFQNWKNDKKAELVIKDTDSKLMKRWQKKQLRISDMTNDELQKRIDRKYLEEKYKRALRGDFTDPKSDGKGKGKNGDKAGNGKKAADSILRKVGDAAVDGLAKGLSAKIEQNMTASAKAKTARREARRDAMAEVSRNAAKERAEFKAQARNARWTEAQRQKESAKQARQKRQYSDSMNRARTGNYVGSLGNGNSSNYYYYASPGDWTIT